MKLLPMILGALFVLIAATFQNVFAHSFYSAVCCSGKDCAPAPLNTVHWSPAGWQVDETHETVPFNDPRIRFTPPGQPQFHLCIVPGQSRVRCLYVPLPEG